MALTRFKRTLKTARLVVRQLTHTLHLPPAQSEIYDGPHPAWLRDVLEQLPNLQSLVVSQLPFFDHASLVTLRSCSSGQEHATEDLAIHFALRLLIAIECKNTTSIGLAEGLIHLPGLVFLDLSNTPAARDSRVLSCLRYMPGLQILKLRNLGLKDEDIDILASVIGVRVRSLDVRCNRLTDESVRTLLNSCFRSSQSVTERTHDRTRAASQGALEDWPAGFSRPDPRLLDEFMGEDLDELFVRLLTKGIISRLPSEDLPHNGITHLYIADNHLTVEGLSSLVRSKRLHILDAGSVATTKLIGRPPSSSSPTRDAARYVVLQGTEKLTPILEHFASEQLTHVRLHHAVVTKDLPPKDYRVQIKAYEIGPGQPTGNVNLEQKTFELDGAERVYELPALEAAPRYELPGDSLLFTLSPPIGPKPSLTASEQTCIDVRRSSIYAPEVAESDIFDAGVGSVKSSPGLGFLAQAVNGISTRQAETDTISSAAEPTLVAWEPENNVELLRERYRNLRSRDADKPHGLSPGRLPHLRTIILTNVPPRVETREVIDKLIQFIRDCATEAQLADIQASLEHSPGYNRGGSAINHHRRQALEHFALRRIVLEMAPLVSLKERSRGFIVSSSQFPRSPSFSCRTLSSTEDADSESLWSAQQNDFSFFDDNEECGLPGAEPSLNVPLATISEKMVLPLEDSQTLDLPTLQQSKKADMGIDVIAELSKFRTERKMAYEAAVRRGLKHVEGYWPGEVKVIRWQGKNAQRRGSVDCYGNYFEKGVYR